MITIKNIEVYGLEAAVRGMRNPMNSWKQSDSEWTWVEDESPINPNDPGLCFVIGQKDLALMKRLVFSGTDHSKFMRMIGVSLDITAPLYWWKEYDTYKVGTVANSCSTMHKIHSKEFTLDDFSHEHLCELSIENLNQTIDALNSCRKLYLYGAKGVPGDPRANITPREKKYWWQMIQLLPSSYNQRRTVTLNYQVLRNIYHARKNHKLDEWRVLCEWIKTLPYSELITE